MSWAFDLDGVLAVAPPEGSKSWGKMKAQERAERKRQLLRHYGEAPALYEPKVKSFFVITARKEDLFCRQITERWLEQHLPNRMEALYMLNKPKTIENVVAFKSEVLNRLRINNFVEDNRSVLRGIRKQYNGNLWWYNGKELVDFRL